MKRAKQQCPYCPAKKADLKRHIEIMHSDKLPSEPDLPAQSPVEPIIPVQTPETIKSKPQPINVVKKYARRTKWLALFGSLALTGLIMFIFYFTGTSNYILALFSILFLFAGAIGCWYYWGKVDEVQVTHIGEVPSKQVNSLIISPNSIEFKDTDLKNKGFIWTCDDDKKKYYVLWENKSNEIEPYNLPDQQICDPEVFGQKFLGLPCHRAWISIKEDLIHKLRWAIVAVIGVGVWILILTTT